MPELKSSATNELATRSGREGALQAALERLAPGPLPDRPDAPEMHVTAVRRLAPVPARFEPFPEELDRQLVAALESRGISRLYSHQAHAIAHALAGRNAVV